MRSLDDRPIRNRIGGLHQVAEDDGGAGLQSFSMSRMTLKSGGYESQTRKLVDFSCLEMVSSGGEKAKRVSSISVELRHTLLTATPVRPRGVYLQPCHDRNHWICETKRLFRGCAY